jgi:hypothetical protein
MRGAVPLTRQHGGDLNIWHAGASEVERSVTHLHPSPELGDAGNLHLDLKVGYGTTAPDDPDAGDIVVATIEHDFFDETHRLVGLWAPSPIDPPGPVKALLLQLLLHVFQCALRQLLLGAGVHTSLVIALVVCPTAAG